MNSIAATARRASRGSALLALLLLGACSVPMPDKPTRPQHYDLGPPLAAATSAAPIGVALAVDAVSAPATLDGSHILYRLMYEDGAQQPRPYAHARWSMTPPQLVTQRLRAAFAATRPVVELGGGLAPLELRAELDDFTQVFSSPKDSEGVVSLRVTVTAPHARGAERLLGQRTFVVRKPAPSADAPGGVSALRGATDEAVRQALDWVNALPAPR
ncbi:MAG: PqiC family protein [Proteobacteria bacterium]|nr:PqiC family protein [Pseudomonadota bacterium]